MRSTRAGLTGFPGFKRHLRAEVGEGAVYLFCERGVTALRGAQVATLAALLDGNQDVAALIRAAPDGMDAGQVVGMVAQLADAGLVAVRATGELTADERELAYWDECGVDAGAADGTARVGLVVAGDTTDPAPVELALRQTGLDVVSVGTARPSASADLTVVLCSDYLDPRLAEVNAAHRGTGRPWLLAKPDGARVWLGPVFQPGSTGCRHCLTNRLWGHRHADAVVQAELGRIGPASRPAPSLPPVASVISYLIALEVTTWLAGLRHQGQQCVWTFDTHDLDGQRHELRARPQCPACGDVSLVAARTRRPVVLGPARKVSSDGGATAR